MIKLILLSTSFMLWNLFSSYFFYNETKPTSFIIDYKNSTTEMSEIASNQDTEESFESYTSFYHSLFKSKRDENLTIAQIGLENSTSLLTLADYFKKATIYGFTFEDALSYSDTQELNHDRIHLSQLNVKNQTSIENAFQSVSEQYELIIDRNTTALEDQLRVIETVHSYLKPGGMIIIEGVSAALNESNYVKKLKPISDLFQNYYFVSIKKNNPISKNVEMGKILVLIKAGDDPIFKNNKKITIITPSIRPWNLLKIEKSINFDYVDEWIIVYDEKKIIENPHLFKSSNNPKIKEYLHESYGISGNPQRNFALDHIQNEDTYLYFLDDDNLMHQDFYKLLDIIDDSKIYTFDQEKGLSGDQIQLNHIDTAMFLIDFKLCKNVRWALNLYAADFTYINECYLNNQDNWIYVHNNLCTYNTLSR